MGICLRETAARYGPFGEEQQDVSASFCWWCHGPLVGLGGVVGREPLFCRVVKTMDDGQDVRVHVKCEQDTIDFFTITTAQPPVI
jgi:hypothetical protein